MSAWDEIEPLEEVAKRMPPMTAFMHWSAGLIKARASHAEIRPVEWSSRTVRASDSAACDSCNGSGHVEGHACKWCNGTGRVKAP